ncbi:GNAT family N-acetyltransferase [Nonomuraea soli]|uniref:Putative N-acetyltransferase YhbS n=1 Tax=Nonomuraea soli TaxID=1032476 RepID=A0A7W0CK16_9ACTN|nr:GNAT family N-acetyltransferase [Nonomuraea soli]MBA2892609.1 putative N-acetyltransferase YhbS [Nonomuraea soli]
MTETPLGDGLILRPGRPSDLDQITALLTERGDAADALDHRLVVEDPDVGWDACAVVVDGDRVVSTATLLDEVVRVGSVRLGAGQVELVATDRAYEGRGLVRALMAWAHERSAARGQVVQVMIGIPYFYRVFGYEYAIDIPPALTVRGTGDGASQGAGSPTGGSVLRPAVPADIPAMIALQEAAQSRFDVAMPHPAPRWRWLLAHDSSTLWVLERSGTVVACARVTPPDDGEVLLAEATAADEAAAADLLRAASAAHAGVRVVHRSGTVTGTTWQRHLQPEPHTQANQYYVRIPDPATLLNHLRPVLWQRLTAAGLEREQIVISTFGKHYRLPVLENGLGEVVTGRAMQSPGSAGGIGVAPDYLPALLFGPLGTEGLARLRPDVYARDKELFHALFPPLSADILSYYLPY